MQMSGTVNELTITLQSTRWNHWQTFYFRNTKVKGTYGIGNIDQLKLQFKNHRINSFNMHSMPSLYVTLSYLETDNDQLFNAGTLNSHKKNNIKQYYMLKPIFFMHSLCASMCVLQFSSPCSNKLQVIKQWF